MIFYCEQVSILVYQVSHVKSLEIYEIHTPFCLDVIAHLFYLTKVVSYVDDVDSTKADLPLNSNKHNQSSNLK